MKLTRVPDFINVTEITRLHISVFVLFRVLVLSPAPGRSVIISLHNNVNKERCTWMINETG